MASVKFFLHFITLIPVIAPQSMVHTPLDKRSIAMCRCCIICVVDIHICDCAVTAVPFGMQLPNELLAPRFLCTTFCVHPCSRRTLHKRGFASGFAKKWKWFNICNKKSSKTLHIKPCAHMSRNLFCWLYKQLSYINKVVLSRLARAQRQLPCSTQSLQNCTISISFYPHPIVAELTKQRSVTT